jgi:tetratricopeptide (TPR) repeat protein
MPSHQSLAELTLDWCAEEILPGGMMRRKDVADYSEARRAALRTASREASKAAGVALLQAAAAELPAAEMAELGRIAAAIDDEGAMTALDGRLGSGATAGESEQLQSPQERGAFVGHQYKEWLEEQLGTVGVSQKVQTWLKRGWPDTRARGGVTTFYQAFCGALQRAVRQDQGNWDEMVKNTGVDAAAWRQWLIRESNTGTRVPAQSAARRTARAIAFIVLIAAVVGAGAWYWWNEIKARLQTPEPAAVSEANFAASQPGPTEPSTPSPPATPRPKPPPTISPKTSALNLRDAEPELPRVQMRPDPFAEAARLMDQAEATLGSDETEAGDRAARSAHDILSARPGSSDATLAESLTRLALYWERRDDWPEAVRLHQRAVKAYEKTPAENAGPQLQAVNRWAEALRHTGRNTEAERLYRMLLQAYEGMGSELRPDMASVAHSLGNVMLATDRLREARECYTQALTLIADRQADPAVQPLVGRFKGSLRDCLRKLGISEAQIDADLRQVQDAKIPSKHPSDR